MIFVRVVGDLLNSEYLKKLEGYPSHNFSLVVKRSKNSRRDHCLRVGYLSFLLCKLLGGNFKVCARAGILHDLGYDRQNVHKPLEQIFGHARKGAVIVQKMGEDARIVEAIRTHMFPIGGVPKNRESFIVWFADKLDGLFEIFKLSKLIEKTLKKMIRE
ncbi:MAG: HDIG domain-containing protein [Candidatus Jordarchaeaceae archaeon]